MIELSSRTTDRVNATVIEPQLILEIDGLPLFGSLPVYRIPRVGDPGLKVGMKGLKVGIPFPSQDALPYIDLKASSSSLQQQLSQDKGSVSSVSNLGITLVDKNELLTKFLSPGIEITDLLSRNANVYLNFGGGSHPEDSVPVMYGVIDTIDAGPGTVKLTVAHPDGLKRQEIFTQIQTTTLEKLRFRNRTVRGIEYQTQDQVVGLVTIRFIAGGTKGSEAVTVFGNNITIAINPSLTTSTDIRNAIDDSQAATDLVKATVTEDNDDLLQIVGGPYTLDSSSTLDLDSVNGMLLPINGIFETYVRIEDEIVRYTGISGTTLTGISGAKFETIGKSHDAGSDVQTFYRLLGGMKDLALQIMLSGGDRITGVRAKSVITVSADYSINNALVFTGVDVAARYGVTEGCYVSSSGSLSSENNFDQRTVLSVGIVPGGSFVVVDGEDLVPEQFSEAMVGFWSQYDVLPDGLEMRIDQVDVQQHEDLERLFPSAFFQYDIFLKGTVTGNDFLSTQIYFPSACYSIPRKGRASIGMTIPPLAQASTKVLDERNVMEPSQIRIVRSINKYFYNSVVYKYEQDAVEDKYRQGKVTASAASYARVPNVRNLPLVIDADGIRNTGDSKEKIVALSQRYLDRYQFGAEYLTVKVLFKTGFNTEVGDTVIFGSSALQISDSSQGSRQFKPRVMEVQNKTMDMRTGNVSLILLSTVFGTEARYGVIAPSSTVDAGATESVIPLKLSQLTPVGKSERYKWEAYVGQVIAFHDEEWTYYEETTLTGFTTGSSSIVTVSPPLSAVPSEGVIMDAPQYPAGSDATEKAFWKNIHAYFDPHVPIVAQVSSDQISVAADDISKFFVGSTVRIHNGDFSKDTDQDRVIVTAIQGNVLKLSEALSFAVDSTFSIDLIGFPDQGGPYRII